MYNYLLLVLVVLLIFVFYVSFRKEKKSLLFVLSIAFFMVELSTIAYRIVVSENLELILTSYDYTLQMQNVLLKLNMVEVVFTNISCLVLVAVVLTFYIRNRKLKNKSVSERCL